MFDKEPGMRDVTGDEDDKHFGPKGRDNDEDEDSYNTPNNARKGERTVTRPPQRQSRDEEPSEGDLRKKKEEYSEEDFQGEVTGGGEGVVVPEDVYEVRCVDVVPSMMKDKFKNNAEVPKIRMVFEILNDPDYEGVKISRILNRNYAQKSNLVIWYSKITGEEIEKGTKLDIRKCKGKECRISVNVYEKEGSGEKKNKIVDVLQRKRKV